MQFRIRGPSGQATLSGIDDTITIADFQQLIAEKTNITPQSQEIKAGFPPRLVSLPVDFTSRSTTPLSSLNLLNGDTLIISEAPLLHKDDNDNSTNTMVQEESTTTMADDDGVVNLAAMTEEEQIAMAIAASMSQQDTAPGSISKPTASTPPPVVAAATAKTTSQLPLPLKGSPAYHPLADGTNRAIVRRIVPDDNSCLFSSISYVMYQTQSRAQELRRVAANAVLADPHEFNEAVLGKEPSAYAAWIQNPARWGGAIELSIFSRHFKKEIAAFDVQTKRVDVYGEGERGYGERVMVVYDGLHYDALAVAASDGGGEGGDVTQLKVDGGTGSDVDLDVAMTAAGMLVERFHVHRQFTDTANFTLRCSVCKVGLVGEKEAVEHANKTGHANFEEY